MKHPKMRLEDIANAAKKVITWEQGTDSQCKPQFTGEQEIDAGDRKIPVTIQVCRPNLFGWNPLGYTVTARVGDELVAYHSGFAAKGIYRIAQEAYYGAVARDISAVAEEVRF